MNNHTLVWLRNDLRVHDNPALDAALLNGGSVTALYIYEEPSISRQPTGAALWWLEKSLEQLASRLAQKNIALFIEKGDPAIIIEHFVATEQVTAVFWNRRYAHAEREHDSNIKYNLKIKGIKTASFTGNLLIEPWQVMTGSGSPYQVYTPFAKALHQYKVAQPLTFTDQQAEVRRYSRYNHNPQCTQPEWANKLVNQWDIGEEAASKHLACFFENVIGTYTDDRDRPFISGTSKLSPYLRFGEISVRQIWHETLRFMEEYPSSASGVAKFLSELIWRDFHYHQLYHRADITTRDMRPTLSPIEWRNDTTSFRAWTKGRTGIPIIDAGMRQLWATGWMHNRVRMLVASFLTKNLLIDWRVGEAWFWDTLVDADVASNPASWQWVAGCGMDAAPYFRVFNPVVQGKRFDPDGTYVRQWVPELELLPSKWVHCPEQAPVDVLRQAGIKLGTNYPLPITDLATSQRLFKELMKEQSDFE